ncbi:peptide-methionine (R)-S-oxide reductase MsrB [Polycladidibacter stylochi]|uniref:peptide-methionine (R)-S-oxide reductase MsrB n=1 Tax=Polycladidibacter stylochi TaxID=1807766 RepID=UPI00082CCFC9|nr:peptide-methionine (R)-S-oxide reductase MsrB [Pseudovibrio stylochi]
MSHKEFKKIPQNDREWREKLTAEQYRVLREGATERPFTSPYNKLDKPGVYSCAGCGSPLFLSDHKFDAGCGWPSFFEAVSENGIEELQDFSHGMVRTEIKCAKCKGHLGHVFPDGPPPTGLRYCLNGLALNFKSITD